MNDRILPEPDHFATCPMNGKILQYYDGIFDSVYVLLHPFSCAASQSKEHFNLSGPPGGISIIDGREAVRWSEIISRLRLPSLAALDVGLRSQIGGLRASFANDTFAAMLRSFYQEHNIVPPTEGRFSDFLYEPVLQCFHSSGHQWVWVGDEFGTERKLHWIDDLKMNAQLIAGGHCNVFSADKKLLWTTHWDSHFSLLCGSSQVLETLVKLMNFEGFFCSEETEVYWSI